MLAALDVQYDDTSLTALAAAVVFERWNSSAPLTEFAVSCADILPYQPGEFYRRELPCLLEVLKQVREPLDAIIIDGYVGLGQRPGLGFHLWNALHRATPIVGVAKTSFHAAESCEVLRGESRSPLYVTTVGLDVAEVAELVRSMNGEFRIPTILKRVDQLARGGR